MHLPALPRLLKGVHRHQSTVGAIATVTRPTGLIPGEIAGESSWLGHRGGVPSQVNRAGPEEGL